MTNGNEPAHPCNYIKTDEGSVFNSTDDNLGGLTKREYFAAMAMQGMVAATFSPNGLEGGDIDSLADYAVHQADALIKELNKTNNENT